MSFSITVKGLDGLSKTISSVDMGLKNFSKPLRESDRYMNTEIQRNFDTSGSTLSDGWDPLAPNTIRKKGNSKILVGTGKMKKSFSSRLSATKLVIGNKAKYFKYHQSSNARKKLPRRVMLGLKQAQVDTINKFFGKYIKSLFR